MSKQLETLLKKAKQNSVATLNGRQVERDYGYTYTGDLEEKWAIEFNNESMIVELRHWGTKLIEIDYLNGVLLTDTFYAESKSDIDGINWFLTQFPVGHYHAHYYPSRETAELHDRENKVLKAVK